MKKKEEFSYTDFRRFVESKWKELELIVSPDEELFTHHDPHFFEFLDDRFEESTKSARENLQPWLDILEMEIMCISSLHMILEIAFKEKHKKDLQSSWALTAAICSQLVSIRLLSLAGLDVSAKVVVRTLLETLSIWLVTFRDPVFRKKYPKAQDFSKANKLWLKEIAGKQNEALESEFIERKIEDEVRDIYINWLKDERLLLNQTVHTSYIAAAMSCYSLSLDKETFSLAFFGTATLFSFRTISLACQSVWLFMMISLHYLLHSEYSISLPLPLDKSDNWVKSFVSSWAVLDSTIQKYYDAKTKIKIPK
jgi:hypothetical protein